MGGYLAVADELDAEVVVPVCASAPPSGPVDSEAYETFCRMITDAVAQGGFDALWLDLHGAMVTERYDDGEGELLRRIRAIDPTHAALRRLRHARQRLRCDGRAMRRSSPATRPIRISTSGRPPNARRARCCA